MDDKIRELIDTIIDENPVGSEATFNDLMVTRVADRIDTYRQEVANTYFNPVAEEDIEVEELATEEQADETE
jgi:hypothetical protein